MIIPENTPQIGDKKEQFSNQKLIIQTYNLLWTELENLYIINNQLFRELKIGPLYNEGRPEETFKEREFKRDLQDRLNSFRIRLIEQYPKYKNIINNYCDLFLAIEINPININKEEELFDILSKRFDK